jgi:penicillin-binding protein 2
MANLTLKDHFRETQLFNVRAIVALIICSLLIVVLIVRMMYLQVVEHELYTTLSENNRFHIGAVPPTRGLIYDRNGVILAQNLPTYTRFIVPVRVDNLQATVEALAKLIPVTESDIKRFNREVKRARPFKPVALRIRLSDEEMARIAVNRHRFPGVDIAARLIRHYPDGELYVHALGYVGRINEKESLLIDESDYDGTDYIGKTGIEKYYEDILHGHVGVRQVETNASGRRLRVIEQVPSEPGLDLHLTLDSRVQAVAAKAMGEHRGAVIAMDPRNGDIITFVSMPGYDPNLFVKGIDIKTYQSLRNSDQIPLFNRALRGRYPPGSTVKPFIALAGLELGVVDPEAKTYCPGWYRLPNVRHKYRDWKKEGHGHVDLETGIVRSCDVYFYTLANTLGIDRMSQYLKELGFGSRTGVDISDELAGLMPSRRWKRRNRNAPWYQGETVITGIGQGFTLITPLQLAASTATIATYGRRVQPRIVGSIRNINTDSVEETLVNDSLMEIQDLKNWQRVVVAMTKVVNHWRGTAYRIGKDAKYKIAGKTGTAQVFSVKQNEEYDEKTVPEKLRDHALFIAFAPVEDPRIAIAVVVENGGHGGSTAAPIARKVMDAYLLPQLKTKVKDKKSDV